MNIYDGSIIGSSGGTNDGYAHSIYATGGIVNIHGGVIDSSSGGTASSAVYGGGIDALGGSTVNIYGTGFNYGFGPISDFSGIITGTLANGDVINSDFLRGSGASIVLIPEPCSLALLGLGGLLLRKRKK